MDSKLKSITDRIYKTDPVKFRRLIVWIKTQEAKGYDCATIQSALSLFGDRGQTLPDNWWPYLSGVIKRRASREYLAEVKADKAAEARFAETLFGGRPIQSDRH